MLNIFYGQIDNILIILSLFLAAFSLRQFLLLIGQRWVVTDNIALLI